MFTRFSLFVRTCFAFFSRSVQRILLMSAEVVPKKNSKKSKTHATTKHCIKLRCFCIFIYHCFAVVSHFLMVGHVWLPSLNTTPDYPDNHHFLLLTGPRWSSLVLLPVPQLPCPHDSNPERSSIVPYKSKRPSKTWTFLKYWFCMTISSKMRSLTWGR